MQGYLFYPGDIDNLFYPGINDPVTADASCTAFAGSQRIASGSPAEVAVALRRHLDWYPGAAVLVFDDATAQPVEFDLRGTAEDVAARLKAPPRGRGRPKLGVQAREVTLLPRHWDWLAAQPGGASVALRKLVDTARAASITKDRVRNAQAAAHRFMTAMAGNAPGYEEALRALYAGDRGRFDRMTADWPKDVRGYAMTLAVDALQGSFPSSS